MRKEITYEQAKEAKEILLQYLEKERVGEYESFDSILRNKSEWMAYLALKADYFLD